MTFHEILSGALLFWNAEIDFSDGLILEPKKLNAKYILRSSLSNSFFSSSLSRQFEEIQKSTDRKNLFAEVMHWTIYEYLLKECHNLFVSNQYIYSLQEMDNKALEELYFKNLQEGFYLEELEQYNREL